MNPLYVDFLEKNKDKKILIYGAGIVAYSFAQWLIEGKLRERIEGFAVQNASCDVGSYFDIPVKEISEYADTLKCCCIVVAVKERLHDAIGATLAGYGCKDIYFLRESEYEEIKAQFPDIKESEYMIRQLELLRKKLCLVEQDERDIKDCLRQSVFKFKGSESDRHRYAEELMRLQENEEEYLQNIDALCSGLEAEDVRTIYGILGRLNQISMGGNVIASQEEEKILKTLARDFYLQFHKLSEHTFCYELYRLPFPHFEPSVLWYDHGIPLLKNLDAVSDKCVIDAGAFIGDSALVLRKYIKGDIYCFEADAENFAYIADTVRMNHLENVFPVNMALLDRCGTVNLYNTTLKACNVIGEEMLPDLSRLDCAKLDGRVNTVPCITIDEFVKSRRLSVGLIKSDVEGAEQSLLRGAAETIRTQKPTLIISIYHSMDDFFHIKQYIDSLNVGYRYKIFHPILAHSILEETCLLCEIV